MANYLNADKLIEGSLGLDSVGIGQLRAIEWSRKYLWSFNFVDFDGSTTITTPDNKSFFNNPFKDKNKFRGSDNTPQAPFDSFFPAVDVDVTEITVNNFQSDAYMTSFKVPQKMDLNTLKITFYDDQDNSLYRFMRDWVTIDIFNRGRYVSPLADCVRAVELRKIKLASIGDYASSIASAVTSSKNKDASIAEIQHFWVIPDGQLPWNGSSNSEANLYTMDFIIVGQAEPSLPDGGLNNTLLNIAKSLGASAVLGGAGVLFNRR